MTVEGALVSVEEHDDTDDEIGALVACEVIAGVTTTRALQAA
jgi:hypothetical protein